ncbi:nicotinate mononucleotide-dependent phosphoribosyltransferase CobT [Halomarina salina]|uniref:UPF0284 protein ACFPYI_00750 n=1 Tax=Halomarina salina TaxID=1872699 RepID=A0ABD5RHM1_9EURY
MTDSPVATDSTDPTFALVVGTTETAAIDGISAAGANPALLDHTPSADAELVAYGTPVYAPTVPVSPGGCPTPALVTRAVRELVGFDLLVVDGGLSAPSAAPTVEVGATPGSDIREPTPVPDAAEIVDRARRVGRAADGPLVVGESVPGGTTTALGVLTALGEPFGVSSSLPTNPLELKRRVVEEALTASDLDAGSLAGSPVEAVARMGDPVLATVMGLVVGAAARDAPVTLAGGTQMVAAAALVRHAGVDHPLTLATTSFVDGDDSVDVRAAAEALDCRLSVTDPGFDRLDHAGLAHYSDGVGKEGAGMGGALALARTAGVEMASVRDRVVARYEREIGPVAGDAAGGGPADDEPTREGSTDGEPADDETADGEATDEVRTDGR